MRQQRDVIDPSSNQGQPGSNSETTHSPSDTTTPPIDNGPPRNYNPPQSAGDSSTDTIAAITVALLAVLIIFSVLLIFRAIRKRRRAMRGTEINAIPTISTGVMGTGVSAYGNVAVSGPISWESIDNGGNNRDGSEVQGAMAMASPSHYDNAGFT